MITPSDKSYQETKQIKLGKSTIKQEFKELAEWINITYQVNTLNIIYDINNWNTPRLEVCFEFKYEALSFNRKSNERFSNFDIEKQSAIAQKFKQTLFGQKMLTEHNSLFEKTQEMPHIPEGIWVIYGAFEPIAKTEANESVSKEDINELKRLINNKDLWEISRLFSGVTFFLHTDEQLKKYENSEVRKEWANKYFDILEKYNEFGYFKRENFYIYLDSKENFDKNYQSNWYYYYK